MSGYHATRHIHINPLPGHVPCRRGSFLGTANHTACPGQGGCFCIASLSDLLYGFVSSLSGQQIPMKATGIVHCYLLDGGSITRFQNIIPFNIDGIARRTLGTTSIPVKEETPRCTAWFPKKITLGGVPQSSFRLSGAMMVRVSFCKRRAHIRHLTN